MPAVESNVVTTDLEMLAQGGPGIVWNQSSEDLNLNLMVLAPNGEIAEHVNPAVDVLLVGVRGGGTIAIDGEEGILGSGRMVLVPRGARRSIAAGPEGLAYLTCHRRRPGLWPEALRHGAAATPPAGGES